jgi:hypothetical protein
MRLSVASNSEERRVRVVGDRVACWRLGSVALDRCRECLYLLRLEADAAAAPRHVVCADVFLDDEAAFAW